jgi:hypothetical protein
MPLKRTIGNRRMRCALLATYVASCLLGAPTLGWAQSATVQGAGGQCLGTASPQVRALLAQFPGGGPGLRAAVAQIVEANALLADEFVYVALKAKPAQKEAIGMGLADAANYFAKCGLDRCRGAESRIRTAMVCADPGTRVGFVLGSAPTLVQGIPGFNNAGATTNGCSHVISPSGPGGSSC